MANQNRPIIFGYADYATAVAGVGRSSSPSGDHQSPESARPGVELESGVGGVESNGVLGDGSERKGEESIVKESDQVCSVSESPVRPVAGEYSGEGSSASSVVVELKNWRTENEESGCYDFNELIMPFDINGLSVEDALENKEYSGEADQRLKCLEKDLDSSNIWSSQYASSYDPFRDHIPNGKKVDGFSMGRIHEMMSGLSVRDLISSSSNTSSRSAVVNSFTGRFGGQVVSDQYTPNIHLNGQVAPHYAPPMMTGMSLGASRGSSNILAPSGLVNSSVGLVGGQEVSDQYTHNIHLNSQVSPYALLVGPMTTGFTSGAWSSPINVLNGVETNINARRFNNINKTFLELAMSRDGSQYFIDLMAKGNRADTATILAAVATDVFQVIGSPYGFELFSNLLKFCDNTQKEFLLERIVFDPVGVILRSQNLYGSKALIELVDHLKLSRLVHQIPLILATEIKPLLLDRFASRLIQHCLFVLKPNECEPLYEAMIECACFLALDSHRVSLLYNLVDNIKGVHKTILLNKLADNSALLATHPTGNYVVKRVLDSKDVLLIKKISYLLRGYYKTLAMDKHGSHVVEACIQSVGIHFVMDELLTRLPEEIEEMACHQFGNYVIQKALEETEKHYTSYREKLVGSLLPGFARLRQNPHGKDVYKKLKDKNQFKNGRGRTQYRR